MSEPVTAKTAVRVLKAAYVKNLRMPMERALESFDRFVARIDASLGPSKQG